MSALAGRGGRLYMALASGGVAESVALLNTFSIDASSDRHEVTAFGDANKIYVAGMPDASGSLSGFYDDATVQTYTAATDGVARKFYMYPERTTQTKYWFGTAFFDFSSEFSVDGAATMSGTWQAASAITKVG